MSMFSVVLNLGTILGPPLVGFASDLLGGGGVLAFYGGIAVLLFLCVLARMVEVRRRRRKVVALVEPIVE